MHYTDTGDKRKLLHMQVDPRVKGIFIVSFKTRPLKILMHTD
jgi:hypothetical protein